MDTPTGDVPAGTTNAVAPASTSNRRRLTAGHIASWIALVLLFIVVVPGLLMPPRWLLNRGSMPVQEPVGSRPCPQWTGGPPVRIDAPRAGLLLPEEDYLDVALCPAGNTPRSVSFRGFVRDQSATFADRVNALPASVPTTRCDGRSGATYDLVLRRHREFATVIIPFEATPCGVVHLAGTVRYDGARLLAVAHDFIDDGDL